MIIYFCREISSKGETEAVKENRKSNLGEDLSIHINRGSGGLRLPGKLGQTRLDQSPEKALKKQEKYIEARDDRMRILEQVHQRREELEADANQ